MHSDDEFGLTYDREAERVLVFLTRRTLDVTIAADITAETFALAFASWSRLQGRSAGEVRAWLFTVAERQVSRYLRRARVERRAIKRLGLQIEPISEDEIAVIEERAGLGELRGILGAELARLSAEQRDALRLRVVEDRSYPEVAAALGVSEQAARARVSRGLRALAAALEPYRMQGEPSR